MMICIKDLNLHSWRWITYKRWKNRVIKRFDGDYDYFKVVHRNDGIRRNCENCQKNVCNRILCSRVFGIKIFKLNIRKWYYWCVNTELSKESLIPYMIIEWIPYENLQNFKYLIQGGLSKIYSADWIDGHYKEWDHEESSVHRDLHSGNILYSKKKMIGIQWSWFLWTCW